MKNTSKLTSEEFEEIKISSSSVEEVEKTILKEHLGQIKTYFSDKEEEVANELMKLLSEEKNEGEKQKKPSPHRIARRGPFELKLVNLA